MTDEEKAAAEARGFAKGVEAARRVAVPAIEYAPDQEALDKELRALQSDPSLVVVKREELERLRNAIEWSADGGAAKLDHTKAVAILDAMLGGGR